MSQKRIIDKRRKEKYMVDDEYLNGMARLCGWKGTIVYNSLCRHASKDQECFPAIQKMAEQHGVSRRTIIKGIQILENRRVIEVGKKRTKSGQWLNNTYTLLDKSEWDYSQVHESNMDTQVHEMHNPSARETPDQVHEMHTKETHSEGNTLKETHYPENQRFSGDTVNEILNLFYEHNPGLNHGNKTERKTVEWFLEKYGEEKTKQTVNYALSIQDKPYSPTITKPTQLKNKLGDLRSYIQKQQNNSPFAIQDDYEGLNI